MHWVKRMRSSCLLLVALTACEGNIAAPGTIATGPGGPGGSTGSGGGATGDECAAATDAPGHWALRRLTNAEYTNTARDLLFTAQSPGSKFQDSLPGGSGFRNDGAALSIYSTLVAGYYTAATALAKEVIDSKATAGGAFSKLVTCNPTQAGCAQATVSALATRALRRPVTAEDLDATSGLMAVFNAGGNFDQGLYDTLVALLMHPEFLMIPVVDARSLDAAATFELDDYEVASRLSYFLWQSMPDDALFASAAARELHDPTVLAVHVKRMLKDRRAVNLKNVLRDELADLGTLAKVDFAQLGQTNTLRDAMIGETDAFLNDLIVNDRSALTLLSSEQSFVNKTLADFYGVAFTGSNPSAFVPLAAGRRGLGAQAAVLTNSAGGSATFTNPIKRGHWVAKTLYCDEPAAPPPNIPPLPPATVANPTIRQRLDVHLNQAGCVSCHAKMDAFGLGAENYDALGRWRTKYEDGNAVDATGAFPDGTKFDDSKGLYDALAKQTNARSCVAQQLMKLGLSRPMKGRDDRCKASTLSATHVAEGATFSELVSGIVTTPQFLKQTGEAP